MLWENVDEFINIIFINKNIIVINIITMCNTIIVYGHKTVVIIVIIVVIIAINNNNYI